MKQKKLETLLYSAVGIVAMALILVAANYIAATFYARKDLTADKTTYPNLLGLEESRQRADALVAEAKAALAPFASGEPQALKAAPLLALADFITSRDR